MAQSLLIVGISLIVCTAMLIALVRLAYMAGRSDALRVAAEEKQKRLETAARSMQQFDANYADLTDEDLKRRLRNL